MTGKQFYDWQTAGGADDVSRLVAVLERGCVAWCAIGGVAVNHWAGQPMVTQDFNIVARSKRWTAPCHCWNRPGSAPNGSNGPST